MALESPKRSPKALERFLAAHRQYEWEQPCPPGCTKNHDRKWWGVTVPMPKKKKEHEVVKPVIAKSSPFYLPGASEPTAKQLRSYLNAFGECPELLELARLYGIDLKLRKEKTV